MKTTMGGENRDFGPGIHIYHLDKEQALAHGAARFLGVDYFLGKFGLNTKSVKE